MNFNPYLSTYIKIRILNTIVKVKTIKLLEKKYIRVYMHDFRVSKDFRGHKKH